MGMAKPIAGKTGAEVFISPLASSGTKEMDTQAPMGKVSGVEDHAGTPDPLGYLKAGNTK